MHQDNIQKVLNIHKEIKTYDYNPVYILHMGTAAGFSYELLINDKLHAVHFTSGTVTGSMPLVNVITKSGKQRIKIRMFPPVKKGYVRDSLIDPKNMCLEFRIVYGDEKRDKPNDFKEIFKYEMPKFEHPLPYYEVNLVFEAEVPYELESWTEGVDLTKEDKDVLLKEVEAFYKEMIGYYENKDVNALAGKYYKRQKAMGQALYEDKIEDYEYLIEEWTADVNKEQTFEFKDYELRFFGDGKIVALIKNDKYYSGESALFSRKKPKGWSSYNLFLYRSTPNAPLEVIR